MWCSTVGVLLLFTLSALVAPRTAEAQQATKVYRIGLLSPGSPPASPTPNLEAFLQGLRDLGYVEGQNLTVEYRYAENNLARFPDLAAELVRLPVDVIVPSSNTPATLAAKQATSTIPIVMAGLASDPVAFGLVASLAQPGGNVTGVTISLGALWGKRLDLLKEAVPRLARVAFLWNPENPANAGGLGEVQAETRRMGVQLHALEVRNANAFVHAFAALAAEPPDALLTAADSVIFAHRRPLADFALRSRLPTMTSGREYVEAGALMAYVVERLGAWRRAAYYVDKILQGTKPADLPVERAMKFELLINLTTAQALGLTMPPTLLFQADEVIR